MDKRSPEAESNPVALESLWQERSLWYSAPASVSVESDVLQSLQEEADDDLVPQLMETKSAAF